MKSLLHKTLSQFLVCTVAIFILTTPLFFSAHQVFLCGGYDRYYRGGAIGDVYSTH